MRGLSTVEAPQPVNFPLPNPRDHFSLKPGSLASCSNMLRESEEEKSPALVAAISGARAAATQFSKNSSPGFQDNRNATRTKNSTGQWVQVQRSDARNFIN